VGDCWRFVNFTINLVGPSVIKGGHFFLLAHGFYSQLFLVLVFLSEHELDLKSF
jgi:hypothetical protein